jgi:RNA polymerase sigma factor (sigma-70 family)
MITNEEVEQWKPLIIKIANKYRNNPYKLELEDIEQIGYIGLIRGLKVFDEERGIQLKTHLYNYIQWSIKRELEYWKHDKRATLHKSSSIDISIGEDNDITIGETIQDSSINIENNVIDNLLIDRYREEVIKTLKDHKEQQVELMVLFNDSSMEHISSKLNLDIENTRKIHKKARDKLGRNMFIRTRYKEYKRSISLERYESINYHRNTQNVATEIIRLEQQLFGI